ncbi:hypothetical protein OXT66_07860 [Lentilactobacillus senioris]|uniref:hypothetical protein n=1 Tax=Lentilactobacillus senioris TaxID=931534 RepID=UPI00227E59CD|nr:hypothetical protein [Lentilactobacillus senioris]MCY9807447.1 hypothetical protein [Lentilactobacillus senioris]
MIGREIKTIHYNGHQATGGYLNHRVVFSTGSLVSMTGNYYNKIVDGKIDSLTNVKNKENGPVTTSGSIAFKGIPGSAIDPDYLALIIDSVNSSSVYTKNSDGSLYTKYVFNGLEAVKFTKEMNDLESFTDGGKVKLVYDVVSDNIAWDGTKFSE